MLALLAVAALKLAHFVCCVYATVRSAQGRFALGVAGGLVRACLLIVAFAFAFRVGTLPSSQASSTEALISVGATWLGAIVCFATLFAAHHRTRDLPAAQEEAAGRPFMAWLPVGILDALTVLLAVVGSIVARDP